MLKPGKWLVVAGRFVSAALGLAATVATVAVVEWQCASASSVV